jgi:phosphoglycerol transferase MdoB-like AlkP superfamily enzyme
MILVNLFKPKKCSVLVATLWQAGIALVLLWLSRILFFYYNTDGSGELLRFMWAGLPFDLSAWAYFNALFLVMRFLPVPFVAARGWLRATDVVYYVTNGLMLVLNVGDTFFFPFQGTRLRLSALKSFFSDPNLGGIFLSYAGTYWWAFLVALLGVALLVWLYRRVVPVGLPTVKSRVATWALRIGAFLVVAAVLVLGMRGRMSFIGKALKPADAARCVEQLGDMNVVLNTPFTILHSLHETPLEVLTYFSDEELARLRTSLVTPRPSDPMSKRNVMLIVIESGGQHWIDRLNNAPGAAPRGLMPFLDSLSTQSLVIRYNFTTGRRSNEGLTAILGGFPMFTPFIYMGSPYDGNTVDALPALLQRKGYATKYYTGANHGSFAIDQMAMMMGMQSVADRETYADDRDFDGVWGIYDHAMARYTVEDVGTLSQPWLACWFTLSSHGPFKVPDDWRAADYKNPAGSMERAMEYVDKTLSYFFEMARRQPWYDNTLFVITGDHGCRDLHGTIYDTPWLYASIPMIIYDPSGAIVTPGEVTDRVMSQVDTGATILGLLGYPDSYVSMGCDVLAIEPGAPHYAIYKDADTYHIISTRLVVDWDGHSDTPSAVYDLATDAALAHPIPYNSEAGAMITYAKAFLQDYTHRLTGNRLHKE